MKLHKLTQETNESELTLYELKKFVERAARLQITDDSVVLVELVRDKVPGYSQPVRSIEVTG